MTTPARTCVCTRNPYSRFQGDAPHRNPEMTVEVHQPGHAPTWVVSCTVCGKRWNVVGIPGGGIYGDFEWERMEE